MTGITDTAGAVQNGTTGTVQANLNNSAGVNSVHTSGFEGVEFTEEEKKKKGGISSAGKILIVAGILIVLIAVWYFLIKGDIDSATTEWKTAVESKESEVSTEELKLRNQNVMLQTITNPELITSRIITYDNSRDELRFLNATLDPTTRYAISFKDPTTSDGTIIRRVANFTFYTDSYEEAYDILGELENCRFRTLVTNYKISDTNAGRTGTPGFNGGASVSVDAQVVFIETASGAEDTQGVESTAKATVEITDDD